MAVVLSADGITATAQVRDRAERFYGLARERLGAVASESELPEIQAWRRAFVKMGLKPTQYRCASESLLRRLRKEGSLPEIHPLIDLCNAVSSAFAVPIAVFDIDKVSERLEVRYADGDETYLTFGGEVEHPEPKEVIFADAGNRAHARRWTNRQSGYSAVGTTTSRVVIVAEAMHARAAEDMASLGTVLTEELGATWPAAATGSWSGIDGRSGGNRQA